jgi:hypothetical protein
MEGDKSLLPLLFKNFAETKKKFFFYFHEIFSVRISAEKNVPMKKNAAASKK